MGTEGLVLRNRTNASVIAHKVVNELRDNPELIVKMLVESGVPCSVTLGTLATVYTFSFERDDPDLRGAPHRA